MKRIILLLFATIIAFSSCENIEDNSPALQGMVDSVFFKAIDVRGQRNEDNSITLQGINQDEKLTIHVAEFELDEYLLGGGFPSYAIYEDAAGNVYSSNPEGEGKITLTDRCISCGWLTGTFWFTGVNSGIDTLRVQKGIFFEASFLGGEVDETPPSDGTMTANVNESPFVANSVTAELNGNTLVITGLKDQQLITVAIPADAVAGNYQLPLSGYSASYTIDGVTSDAISGLISVNINSTTNRRARVFFRFDTENDQITDGNTRVDY
ncbi:MAG: hypothetical protein KJO23_04780 [Bacteroidia bacterium]|nr:hypothetical protein [Bacteroidia bacterium]NNM22004.1 hypothetical protein [Flavobacteriaceae bacterium]